MLRLLRMANRQVSRSTTWKRQTIGKRLTSPLLAGKLVLVAFSLVALPIANRGLALESTKEPDGTQTVASAPVNSITPEQLEFFERKVRPLLSEHCYECHSGEASRIEGGLRLDHSEFLRIGGDSGSAIDESSPTESLLLQAIRFENFEMPPSGKLPAETIAILQTWVEQGAFWPDEAVPGSEKPADVFDLERRMNEHWAWSPIERSPTPDSSDSPSLIDAWIHQGLKRADLSPAPQADRQTLIRRTFIDVHGLPPTNDELERWSNLTEPDWYAQMLDELLASPQFGVRFSRHWLDLVRYAQSRGHEFDEDIPASEQYRDYVVRSFNADVPYDQFLREHLAGDLLSEPRRNPATRWNESILATGFWHLGEWVHSPVDIRKDETDRFDNMVDVFSKTFLGLTVACARCHDHKFDAISTADYYSMFGYLRSSHYTLYRFETDEQEKTIAQQLEAERTKHRTEIARLFSEITSNKSVEDFKNGNLFAYLPSEVPTLHPADSTALKIDFTRGAQTPFRSNGFGFGSGLRDAGWPGASLSSIRTAPDTDGQSLPTINWLPVSRLATDQLWSNLNNLLTRTNSSNRHSQIDQAGKTFITPWFTVTAPHLYFLVRGNIRIFTAIDSYRLISGPLHGEVLLDAKSDKPEEWRWVTSHNLSRYLGKRIHIEFSPLDSMGCEVLQIASSIPQGISGTEADVYAEALHQTLTANTNDELSIQPSPRSLLSAIATERLALWLLQNPEAVDFSPQVIAYRNAVKEWDEMEKKLKAQIPTESHVALGMIDGQGQNDYLLLRGNSDRPVEEVERGNLTAFKLAANRASSDSEAFDSPPSQDAPPFSGISSARSSSGRLELAEALLSDENPLVARVIVNRLWHHLMGRGIVATTDDFGVQGRPPTHPELLDELALRMREENWSMKRLIREICLTQTYQQKTANGPFASQDPKNELLAFANTKKLEGEVVRDSLFLVAGQLNTRVDGGTSKVYLSEFLTGRGRPGQSGPMHGDGRRSLYLEVRRNFLNPMLTAFDMPTPFSSMGRRNVSNVPAQALTMLNDPMLHWLAEQWAKQVHDSELPIEKRVVQMFQSARGRLPSERELATTMAFLTSDSHKEEPAQEVSLESWQDLAHVLLNSKELQFNF